MEGNHTETTRPFGVMMLNEVSSDGSEHKLNISKGCDETVSPGLCKSLRRKVGCQNPFWEKAFTGKFQGVTECGLLLPTNNNQEKNKNGNGSAF